MSLVGLTGAPQGASSVVGESFGSSPASVASLDELEDPEGDWLACSVFGLEASGAYRFALTAISSAGVSDASPLSAAIDTLDAVESSAIEDLRVVAPSEIGTADPPGIGSGEHVSDGVMLEWSLPATTGGRKLGGFVVQANRSSCAVSGESATAAGVEQGLSLYVPICGFEEVVTYGHPSATAADRRRMTAVGVSSWPGWPSDGTSTSGAACERPHDIYRAGLLEQVPHCACLLTGPAGSSPAAGPVLAPTAEEILRNSLGTLLSAAGLSGVPRTSTTKFRFVLSRLLGGECYDNITVAAVSDSGIVGVGLPALDSRRDLSRASAGRMIQQLPGSVVPKRLSIRTALPSIDRPPSPPSRPSIASPSSSNMTSSWLAPEILHGTTLLHYEVEGTVISVGGGSTVGGSGGGSSYIRYSSVPAPAFAELFSCSGALSYGFQRSSWFLEGRIRNDWPDDLAPVVPSVFWPSKPQSTELLADLRAATPYMWRVVAVGAGGAGSLENESNNSSSRRLESVARRASAPSQSSHASLTLAAKDPGKPLLSIPGVPEGLNGTELPVQWTDARS